ncbi:MAG: choice-of-anchor D domain-containing protein [Thermoanaerobaculia bacterium]
MQIRNLPLAACLAAFGLLASLPLIATDTVTYTYDANGRLTKADYGGGKSVTYTYDKAGNILSAASQSPDNTLRIFLSPAGAGSVSGPGIACPGTCVHAFTTAQQVSLTATPQGTLKLLAWGGDLSSTANPFAFNLDADRNLTAYFGGSSGMTVPAKGIPDSAEFGPSGNNPGYDGNGDGIPDYQQPNVGSFPTAAGGGYATLAVPNGQGLANIQAVGNPHPADAPGMNFPYGFFAFTVTGVGPSGVVATLYLPKNVAIVKYYKYGPTPDDSSPHWYDFAFNGTTGAEIFQDASQTRILLHLVDAQRGDDVLTVDGQVVDAGGPAAVPAPAIALNPASLDFSDVVVQSNLSRIVSVSNNGDADLLIGTVGQGNGLAAPFTFTGDGCSNATLHPGQTCSLTVRFAPTATGPANDDFAIPSNDPNSNLLTVPVQGNGVDQLTGEQVTMVPALGAWGLLALAASLLALGMARLRGVAR